MEARQLSKQVSADKRVGRSAKRSRPDDDHAPHKEFVIFFPVFYFCFGMVCGEMSEKVMLLSSTSPVSRCTDS